MGSTALRVSGLKRRIHGLFSSTCRNRQSGQAMPLGIAAILVGFVGAFMLFNTGQVAVDKQRLSDASDSAAYSGMVWQARAMNFQAYTNRAMIANDVTIGQAVSLNSWSNYAAVATGNMQAALGGIPVIGIIVSIVAQIFEAVSQVVTPISEGMVQVVNAINKGIENAQSAMFYSSFLATPDIVKSVADASDTRFNAESLYGIGGLALNLAQWNSFTSKYEHGDTDAMVERTDLISDSREAFATDRKWKFVRGFWIYMTPLMRHRLYYEGETRLMMKASQNGDSQWEWVAKDTMALHTKTIRFKRWRIKKNHIEDPLGWAAAYARDDSSNSEVLEDCGDFYSKDGDPCRFLGTNKESEKWADAGYQGISPNRSDYGPYLLDGYDGIREFRSLSQEARDDEDLDPTLRLRAEITMDVDDVGSSDWVADDTRFSSDIAMAADKMSSISIAEVYYRHPKAYRSSKDSISRQRANGYNPYWDVRLVPVELSERLIALGLRGDPRSSTSTPSLAGYAEYESDADSTLGDNIDTELVADALPEYLSTLATAMGLDEAADDALTGLIDDYIPGGAGTVDSFQAVADVFADPSGTANEIERLLKNEMEEVLKDAIKDILSGVVEDVTGVSVENLQEVDQTALVESLTGVSAAEQLQIETAVGVAEEEAREFVEDMQAIEEKVGEDFETALGSMVADYEAAIQPILNERTAAYEAWQRVENGTYNEDARESAEGTYQRKRTSTGVRIRIIKEQLDDDIVDSVLDSVLQHGSEYFPDGIPRQLVEEDVLRLLNLYLGQTEEERALPPDEEVLGFGEDDEDEGEDPPDDDGGNYGSFED